MIPTANHPTVESTQVTPPMVRKTIRLRKSTEPFDPSVENETCTLEDSPEVSVDPNPYHDLMVEDASLMIVSDVSSVELSADSYEVNESNISNPSES